MPLLHARCGFKSLSKTILLLSIAMSAGCAGPLTKSILVSNDVQEDAETQLLVRNILRARDHLPMHFTAISQVRVAPEGFGLGTPGLAATIPFGGPGAGYTLTPSLTSPSSVDTTPLTSQEFYQGITKPVTGSVMAYYLEQGWPPDLVLNLFIQSIEYAIDEETIGRLDNDGTGGEFDAVIARMLKCEITEGKSTDFTMYGGPQSESSLKDLSALADAKEAKLVPVYVNQKGVVLKDGEWQVVPSAERYVAFGDISESSGFKFQKGSSPRTSGCDPDTLLEPKVSKSPPTNRGAKKSEQFLASRPKEFNGFQPRLFLSPAVSPAPDKKDGAGDDAHASDTKPWLVLRSPEGMLRYLGHLLEKGACQPYMLPAGFGPCTDQRAGVLFRISEVAASTSDLTISYQGKSLYIAPFDKDGDRSVQTLALVMQLLALQNKGTQAPATANVRVLR